MDWIRGLKQVIRIFNNMTSLDSTAASSISSSVSSITPEVEEKKHEEISRCQEISECTHEKEFCGDSDSCESVPECIPDTCNGECQSMGWCEMATDFRNAIVPPIKNKKHPIGCKCKICNAKLVLERKKNTYYSFQVL